MARMIPHVGFWNVTQSSRNTIGVEPARGGTARRVPQRRVRRDGRRGRHAVPAHQVALRGVAAAVRRRPHRARRRPGPQLPGAGHHLLLLRPGVGLPARPDPAADPGAGVGARRGRGGAAGAGAGGVPRRRVRRPAGARRRHRAALAGRDEQQLRPRGRRHRAGVRGAGAPGRHRPGPRRRRGHPGAGGQPAGAVRDLVRGGEPGGAHPGLPGAVPGAAGAAGRRLRHDAAGLAAGGRPDRRRRPDRRAAHPGRAQLGVLRARLPGPQDGHRAGRGPRPALPGQRPVHADHQRAAPGGRGLPADRRRLPGPGAVPAGLDDRLPGAA